MSPTHPLRSAGPALGLFIMMLLPAVATAGAAFDVRFDDSEYLTLSAGTDDGLQPLSADAGGTRGELRDASGAVIGACTILQVDAAHSLARVDRVHPPHTLGDVDHVTIANPAAPGQIKVRVEDPARYFVLGADPGMKRPAGIKPGSKGLLRTAHGTIGGLFTVVAVHSSGIVGHITDYGQGSFNEDLKTAEIQSYIQQVLRGTGFANLTTLNLVMLVIGGVFIYLGIAKEYEPLLLVPIGFGIIIGNIPLPIQIFNAVSVYMIDPVTHEFTFNTTTDSVMGLIYFGVRSGLLPPLIFLGIGALTDFTSLLSNPRAVFLGAAAQVGIFATFLGALGLGFAPTRAAAVGIIGGADGPTAIFLSSRLAPSLIGPIAIAAYSYMAMVPIIQPPIMKLLTTRRERLIRMKPGRTVSRREKILFPIVALIVTTLVAPGGLPLLGMLFFGNLLKESGVTSRLSKTASSSLLDIATILLGIGVGASTSAQVFLTRQSVLIFVLGCGAFAIATAGGILFAKLLNVFSTNKVNPLIGAAGVSAVPNAARVVHHVGQQEDPTNYLLQHALGPNVAGVIGSAIAAGVFLEIF